MIDDSAIAAAMRTYALETAPVLVLHLDANHCVTDANAQARRVLRADALGRPFAEQVVDFNHALDLPALIRMDGTVHRLTVSTASGIPETLHFRFFPLPAGTLALASLDFQEQEKLRDEVLGLNRELNNLTRQLHQANAELRESEIKYRLLFASSPQPLWIYDIETMAFLEVNDAAERHYGYRKDEFLTMTLEDILPPEDVPALFHNVLQTKEHPVQTGESRHLKKNGELIMVEVVAHPVVFRGRLARHALIIDITERKRAEAERVKLEALNRQLLKTESLGRMAGAIAHHFNNQLQAIVLNLELATRNRPGDAEPLEGLVEANQSARKAAEVSNLMLTYLGQAQVENAPLDLAEACRQSLALLRSAMPRGVVLETDVPTPGPVISANANQLQQVLTNLMTNAWEASGDGRGAIRLSVKTVSAADIPAAGRFPINWQSQDSATAYACLEVADAGGGIAAKDFDRLFDPFFSTKFTGRGLGLPVVLGIVRSHDGVVTVESESSRGSTFRVFIPVSAKALAQKPVLLPVSPISKNVRRGTTVLVVEDEPIVRKTLVLVLRHTGFTVLEAEDGVAAVEIFRQHRDEIGCVVCDLTMPRMNGWETLTALRQLVPGIGVILASGYSEAQAMAGDHPEQPQAYLHKPYEAKVLINAINQILPHSNA